ncbi:hypothetical protein VTL71DRAFT_529 [Oculimacula yallundae]|uniref:Uncharacterized protein n=1 Tax=Oculimacula yallundae TaxID=86028 RepID=A0ABR4D2K7_9HELO
MDMIPYLSPSAQRLFIPPSRSTSHLVVPHLASLFHISPKARTMPTPKEHIAVLLCTLYLPLSLLLPHPCYAAPLNSALQSTRARKQQRDQKILARRYRCTILYDTIDASGEHYSLLQARRFFLLHTLGL